MKIGSLDIIKAYLGALELLNSNAFLGDIPLIEGGPTPVGYEGLKFTSTGNSTVALTGSAQTVDFKYSLDGGLIWTQWDLSAISLTDGQTVCLKGNNPNGFGTSWSNYKYFVMTGSISASGNIMSIIDDGACITTNIPTNYCFCSLFKNCSSLTTAPVLPATTLTEQCYYNMFEGCTTLTTAPELPATTLARACYIGMFRGCTSLTSAPTLPATTLADYCYENMFSGCTALTTAPELPATTLTIECYSEMFSDCTNLNYIKCLATNRSASDCTYRWVNNVSETGTFVKAASASWGRGNRYIPEGWTVQDAA